MEQSTRTKAKRGEASSSELECTRMTYLQHEFILFDRSIDYMIHNLRLLSLLSLLVLELVLSFVGNEIGEKTREVDSRENTGTLDKQ